MNAIRIAAPLACLLALAPMVHGGDAGLTGLEPGDTVFGPNLGTKDMTGKLVLVVIWGTH